MLAAARPHLLPGEAKETAERADERSAFCLSPSRGSLATAVPPAHLHSGQRGRRWVPLSSTPPQPSPAQWRALPSSVLTLAASAGRLPRHLTSGTVFPSSFPHAHAQAQGCSLAPEGLSSPARPGLLCPASLPAPLRPGGGVCSRRPHFPQPRGVSQNSPHWFVEQVLPPVLVRLGCHG